MPRSHEIKAWVIRPGFFGTGMGDVVPGANRDHRLQVGEVVDVVRFLLRQGGNVKLGPRISSAPCGTP